jgi:hypothetical protein
MNKSEKDESLVLAFFPNRLSFNENVIWELVFDVNLTAENKGDENLKTKNYLALDPCD